LLAAVVVLSAASPARAADLGIQLPSSQQLDPRLTDLTLSTPALRQPTHVRVLLPSGYDTGQDRYSWPYWQRDLREALPSILTTLRQASSTSVHRSGPALNGGRRQADE
jgi:hypothetical protein